MVFCSNFDDGGGAGGCGSDKLEADGDGFYKGSYYPCKFFNANGNT